MAKAQIEKTKARLQQVYEKEIRSSLFASLGLKNIMQVPRLSKIVLNVGVKAAVTDSKALQGILATMGRVAGQAPVRTLAKKSIAGFKLREGLAIGVMVTLRGRRMYEFLDQLISISLPKVRDFQGVSRKLDGRGSYNLGIKEWTIFPQVEYEAADKQHGLNITIVTTAENDVHGFELLKSFGMPFRKA
jgi:large subunit ribosomal protein L5